MRCDDIEYILLQLISRIVLVLGFTVFLTLSAAAKSATNKSLTPVFNSTPKIILAETASKTVEPRSEAIRHYLAEIFGVPGFKTSWYDNITGVEVTGDIVTIKTNLSGGDEKIIKVCGVVSGFIYSHLYLQLGIRKVKILGNSGEVLVFRRSVLDDCPYKFSRNPGIQPPAHQLR